MRVYADGYWRVLPESAKGKAPKKQGEPQVDLSAPEHANEKLSEQAQAHEYEKWFVSRPFKPVKTSVDFNNAASERLRDMRVTRSRKSYKSIRDQPQEPDPQIVTASAAETTEAAQPDDGHETGLQPSSDAHNAHEATWAEMEKVIRRKERNRRRNERKRLRKLEEVQRRSKALAEAFELDKRARDGGVHIKQETA